MEQQHQRRQRFLDNYQIFVRTSALPVTRPRKMRRLRLQGHLNWQILKRSISQNKTENLKQSPFTWGRIKADHKINVYIGLNSLKLFQREPYLGKLSYQWTEWAPKKIPLKTK